MLKQLLLDEEEKWSSLATFFVERYRVYAASKIGLVSGTVEHDSWPIQKAEVLQLKQNLTALVFGDGSHDRWAPCHVCYSDGVGPVKFSMLRPVS